MDESALIKSEAASGSLKINTMDDLGRMAKMLAQSGYFADAKDAAQCGVKVLAGLELGFPAFASMNGIHIIKGRPSVGANLMAAAIKRSAKYDYRIVELSDSACRLEISEHGNSVGMAEFTIADAKKAGTQNLEKYPKNMLFARAISNAIRWYCPDLFLGSTVYTPEELGEAALEDDSQPAAYITEATLEGDSRAAHITEAQRRRLHAIRAEHGVSEKDLKTIIARALNCDIHVASTKDILRSQYDEICKKLVVLGAQQKEPNQSPSS